MIELKANGDFTPTLKFLMKARRSARLKNFDKYGQEGVAALSSATPVDTGRTASSWYYKITNEEGATAITFCNSNIQRGVPIAIILQYGHGTRNGGWVQGRDYINPAIRPIFDLIADKAWKEVTK